LIVQIQLDKEIPTALTQLFNILLAFQKVYIILS